MIFLTFFRSLNMSMPKIDARPAVLVMRPVSMEIVVDFPAPLWPRSEKIWLLYNLRFMPYTALNPFGKVLRRPSTLRIWSSISSLATSGVTGSKFSLGMYLSMKGSATDFLLSDYTI